MLSATCVHSNLTIHAINMVLHQHTANFKHTILRYRVSHETLESKGVYCRVSTVVYFVGALFIESLNPKRG